MKKSRKKKLMRALAERLPQFMRFFYLRNAIEVSESTPDGVIFKVAETKEELEQAYHILHDSYVESGFQKPHISGLRIIKYFALPTTTTLIAKFENKVIGTMSIVRKGPFGLPASEIFDLRAIEAGGKTVAEVSSLAIAKEFRHRQGTLFLPLCKFFYEYSKKYMQLDRVVIAVNPVWSDFYQGLLLFSPLQAKVIGSYDFANGAPAVGMWSDVPSWAERFNVLYGYRKQKYNFYRYFVESKMSCIVYPERNYERAMDPVMTPEMLDYFLIKKAKFFLN